MITADKAYSKETLQLYQTQDPPAKAAQNSQQNRRSKTEDLTIRRLTWGNKAMKAAFESVKQKLTAQS